MTQYSITPINSGTRMRKDHNTFAAVITSFVRGQVVVGDEIWEAPADGNEVKKGDKWLRVTSVDGVNLTERGLPNALRVDNGPEFLSAEFVSWAESHSMKIQYIQKGEPNQNAYIERFNRTYREEVLSLYLFEDLQQVREVTYWWRLDYNERRPHDALRDRTPAECLQTAQNSTFELST